MYHLAFGEVTDFLYHLAFSEVTDLLYKDTVCPISPKARWGVVPRSPRMGRAVQCVCDPLWG